MNPVKQPKNETFLRNIKTLLKAYRTNNGGKGLVWLSESEYPVRAVRFYHLWKALWGWHEESNKESRDRLKGFVESNGGGSGEKALAELLLSQDNIVSFKRKNLLSAGYDLYIVVNYSKWYVGVRCQLVET